MEGEKCPYQDKYNGDGIEDTGGFDYWSCRIKNDRDLEKYGRYSSIENMCDEEDFKNCEYYKSYIKVKKNDAKM